jgi:hypothetical protein
VEVNSLSVIGGTILLCHINVREPVEQHLYLQLTNNNPLLLVAVIFTTTVRWKWERKREF